MRPSAASVGGQCVVHTHHMHTHTHRCVTRQWTSSGVYLRVILLLSLNLKVLIWGNNWVVKAKPFFNIITVPAPTFNHVYSHIIIYLPIQPHYSQLHLLVCILEYIHMTFFLSTELHNISIRGLLNNNFQGIFITLYDMHCHFHFIMDSCMFVNSCIFK